MPDYSRDQDIGKATKETVNVEEQGSAVVDAVKEVKNASAGSHQELKKLRVLKEIELDTEIEGEVE